MSVARALDALVFDLRFALRQLRAAPAFTLVAALTLALGLGVNSAIVALVDAALLRPLPYPDPDRLVTILETSPSTARGRVSPPNLTDVAARSRSFAAVGGVIDGVGGMVMAGRDGTAETVSRQWVTVGFFDVLGVAPVAGRTFRADDDSEWRNVAVMSETLWRSRFGADPAVVGGELRLDGMAFTIVGIAPAGFQPFGRTSLWALAPITGAPPAARRAYVFRGLARLRPEVSAEAAAAELSALGAALAREFPDTNTGRGLALEPLRTTLVGGELRQTALLFLGVVGVVLLLCCANVASLVMARATARTPELAIRVALGAGRGRLMRQLVTESLVLALLGGLPGLALGWAIVAAAPAVLPAGLLPDAMAIQLDGRVLAFGAAAILVVGVVFGLAPAWHSGAVAGAQALGAQSRTTTGRGGRLRALLVAAEVAAAVVLLVGAGLLLRTLLALAQIDRGYAADQVLTLMVDPLGNRYPTRESLLQFFQAIEDEVRPLPGVASVAWSTALPLGPDDADGAAVEIAGEPLEPGRRAIAAVQTVSPEYFATLALPIVDGRGFDGRDRGDGVPVCLVSEAFARTHLAGRPRIGVRLAFRAPDAPDAAPVLREVVGVVRQVAGRPEQREAPLQIYVPLAQRPTDDIYLLVRPAAGRADSLTGAVRAAIGRVDREQLVSVRDIRTLDEVARTATARHRFRAILVGAFAVLALVLAMAGVYGVVAYAVQLRGRELALRRALGATTPQVVAAVATGTLAITGVGAAGGLVAAGAAARLLEGVLVGVTPLDAVTWAAVLAMLALATAVALAGPLRRAARVDPAAELRA